MRCRGKIIAGILIAVVLLHSIGMNVLYSMYSINRPLFITLFCINKTNPATHCDGSCMLAKIDEQKSHETETKTLPAIDPVQLFFYVSHNDARLMPVVPVLKIKNVFLDFAVYDSGYRKGIFRPPLLG